MLKVERFCQEGQHEGRVGSPCLRWRDSVKRDIWRAELEVHGEILSRGTSGGQSWKSMERFCQEGHQEGRVGSPWRDSVKRDIMRVELEVHA